MAGLQARGARIAQAISTLRELSTAHGRHHGHRSGRPQGFSAGHAGKQSRKDLVDLARRHCLRIGQGTGQGGGAVSGPGFAICRHDAGPCMPVPGHARGAGRSRSRFHGRPCREKCIRLRGGRALRHHLSAPRVQRRCAQAAGRSLDRHPFCTTGDRRGQHGCPERAPSFRRQYGGRLRPQLWRTARTVQRRPHLCNRAASPLRIARTADGRIQRGHRPGIHAGGSGRRRARAEISSRKRRLACHRQPQFPQAIGSCRPHGKHQSRRGGFCSKIHSRARPAGIRSLSQPSGGRCTQALCRSP